MNGTARPGPTARFDIAMNLVNALLNRVLIFGKLELRLLGPFLRIAWPPAVQALGVIVAPVLWFSLTRRGGPSGS